MQENVKTYILPIDEIRLLLEPYMDTLREIMVSEEMIISDAMVLFVDDHADYTPLMEYACEYYSQVLDGDVASNNLPDYQDKLSRVIDCIVEADNLLLEKLKPTFQYIEAHHSTKQYDQWNVFRLGENQVCIGVGIYEAKSDIQNRITRPPIKRSILQL